MNQHLLQKYLRFLAFVISIAFCLSITPPSYSQDRTVTERIAFAAYRDGQWDIYSIKPDGSDLRQITDDTFEDTDPAFSPDGTQLAFASRRENNWDVYVLDLLTGNETRLTTSPHYDGAPTWHPNGQYLAYESYQSDNLDIWQIDAAATEPAVNLTATTIETGDFDPAYSPDGTHLAFSSWRDGTKDIYLLTLTNRAVTRLTDSRMAKEAPHWQPNSDTLSFVQDNLGYREIATLDLNTPPALEGPTTQLTWLGRTDNHAWSPSGQTLAAVYRRWDGDKIMLQKLGSAHELPFQLTEIVPMQGRISWSRAVEFGRPLTTLVNTQISPLYNEQLTPNEDPTSEPYNLIRQNDIDTGMPWLADTVDDSFQAWRQRMRAELGYDFLSQLSDASRNVSAYSETSQYASWHKSGRAIDTLFDYYRNGRLYHEIVREDYSGETYWRVYLRCADQSGRCGRPVTVNPWNYTYNARSQLGPEQGGVEKANLTGYYIDMTNIAREYGWERISSYDDVDYSWTWHFLAFEYWHYQKRLDDDVTGRPQLTNWYEAMAQVYPETTLQRFFTWEEMRALNEDPHLIALKGVPLPLEVRPWWALVKQEAN